MIFDKLEQYYLIRCYPKKEYRAAFNTGSKIYLNSSNYFHSLENPFQQDDEGVVFKQAPHATGKIYVTDDEVLPDLLDVGLFQIQADDTAIAPNVHIADMENIFAKHSAISLSIEDFVFSLPFYICCFYLIPKPDLKIAERSLHFKNKRISRSFYTFLNRYAKEKNGFAFVSIYDAKLLVSNLYETLHSKGYLIGYGSVKYKDFTPNDRINNYKKKDIEALLLTKPTKYSYQHEFRILITPQHNPLLDHIEEKGQNLTNAVCMDFAYLTPDYVKRMKKHEI